MLINEYTNVHPTAFVSVAARPTTACGGAPTTRGTTDEGATGNDGARTQGSCGPDLIPCDGGDGDNYRHFNLTLSVN